MPTNPTMIFAKEPYLLHLLSGSDTITALDATKSLLDSGVHDVNELEPTDNLSPLHVAAAWDNLAMCQLLIHYGANVDAQDIDKRRPLDVATGECRRFLKRLRRKRWRERNKLRKLLGYLFRGICTHPEAVNQSIVVSTEELKAQQRKSCPAEIQPNHIPQGAWKKIISREEPGLQKLQPIVPPQTPVAQPPPVNMPSSSIAPQNPLPLPSAPRRSSSVAREEFLTSDNTGDNEIHFEMGAANSEDEAERRRQADREEALRQQFAQLKLDDLKAKLRRKNCAIGPMDARNRRVYEAKLAKLEVKHGGKQRNPDSINHYSPALQKWILNEERRQPEANQKIGHKEELQIRNEFLQSSANKEVSFFCYLLIDPTRLAQQDATTTPTLRCFLSSIFYVGKGKRSRPLQHLIHAAKCRTFAKTASAERSKKLTRILDLWDRGEGVISMHIFYNIHSAEAFAREGAMIDAIGVDNLTNVQRGTFPGVASTWSRQQITEFGALLLHKAYVIFLNERCRPIFEADVADLSSH